MKHLFVGICFLVLAACSSTTEETPAPSISPNTPTTAPSTQAASDAVVTPEAFSVTVDESGLLGFSNIPAGRVELIYSGVEDAHFRSGNAIPNVELTYFEAEGNPETPERYTPAHYILKINTGDTLTRIRQTTIAFRADVENDIYPITGVVSAGFGEADTALGYVQGQGTDIFDLNPQGFLQINRHDDTFSGSFIMTVSNRQSETLTVQAAFGEIQVINTGE
ncbi:MAG: hypothetical protein Kow00117_02570 [Phototrophicales bacterium]